MHILVIEDDANTASYLRKGLTESGHTVDHAPDGKGGLFMAMEKSYGFSSSFYFQAGGTSPRDTVCYRADDGDIRAVMEAIREAGFEVGLHGSYDSGLRGGLMKDVWIAEGR